MCKNWRGGLIGGVIVAMLAWGLLLSAAGVLSRYANAQEKSDVKPHIEIAVPESATRFNPPGFSESPPHPVPAPRAAAPLPKGITDLLSDLSAIRAKKEELAKAEKDTLAAIRARLKQQKEELAQLEKKLSELGIEPVEQLLPKPEVPKPDVRETTPATGLDVRLPPLPPVDASGKSR